MAISYQVVPGGGQRYKGRAEFHIQGKNSEQEFCQVICTGVEEAGLAPNLTLDSAYSGMPWLTPVIGSGCLDIGTGTLIDAAERRLAAEHAVANIPPARLAGSGNTEWSTDAMVDPVLLVGIFVEALVRDRFNADENVEGAQPATVRQAPDPTPGVDHPPLTHDEARAVLTAALLNRVYFEAKARVGRPVSRTDTDSVSVRGIDDPYLVKCCTLAVSLLESLAVAGRLHSDDAVDRALHRLFHRTLNGLKLDEEVSITSLRLITEAVWMFLTAETPVYPGWTDTLTRLMFSDDLVDQVGSRPSFRRLTTLAEKIKPLLDPAMRGSFEQWRYTARSGAPAGAGARRQAFYLRVAEVLWAQAEVQTPGSANRLPVPSAFVASFDIELLMALWIRSAPDRPFYVVVPVQVLYGTRGTEARLCWLRGELSRPLDADRLSLEEELKALRSPVRWHLVHPGLEDGLDRPHVVHLSGAPLLHRPTIDRDPFVIKQLCQVFGDESGLEPERVVVEHVVTLDEFLALQQADSERLWTIGERNSLALPGLVVGNSNDASDEGPAPRYWMTLGVPVGDPAIRQRIVSLLTVRGLQRRASSGSTINLPVGYPRDEPADDGSRVSAASNPFAALGFGPPDPDPDGAPEAGAPGAEATRGRTGGRRRRVRGVAGVVVNRRITNDEASILYWLGLDVVNDFAECFADDLSHYVDHLRAADVAAPYSDNPWCDL